MDGTSLPPGIRRKCQKQGLLSGIPERQRGEGRRFQRDAPGFAADLNAVFPRACGINARAEREVWDQRASLHIVFPQCKEKSRFAVFLLYR